MKTDLRWEPYSEYWLRTRYLELLETYWWREYFYGLTTSEEDREKDMDKLNLEFKEKFPNIAE